MANSTGKWNIKRIVILFGVLILFFIILACAFPVPANPSSEPLNNQRDAANSARAIVGMVDGVVSSIKVDKYTNYPVKGENGTAFVSGSGSRSRHTSATGDYTGSVGTDNYSIEFVGYCAKGYSTKIDGTITYYRYQYSEQAGLTYSGSDTYSYSGKDVKITSPSVSDTVSFNINRKGLSGMSGTISGLKGSWKLE
jgi:hypothetical protein